MSVVKKKKHVSKKNKKAWRKYCDIRDVEQFLEEQRTDERLGITEIKEDHDLFVTDTVGDVVDNVDGTVEDVKPVLSAKLRKRAQLSTTPKCFEILLPSSKVKDPNAKRNHVNPVGFKPTSLSKLTEKRRYEKGTLKKKVELARKNRQHALDKKRKMKQIRQTFDKDIWGDDLFESKGIPKTLCDDFISPEAQLHNVLTEKRLRQKPPPPKILAARAAVEIPHPGVSYNPTYQEHQELLKQVVEHEQKMIKREKHLNRVTTGMFKKVTVAAKENQWREEMSAGLPHPHNPAKEKSDSDSDGEYRAINPPVKNKKKDHKARRKQRERLQEKERLKREKIDKKKISDIYKLRKFETWISKKERKQAELRAARVLKRASAAAGAPPALNANKVPPAEPELVEPTQLSGDLTHLHSNANLLRERFESLQRRGALAASKLMMKKKRKLKSYFKQGYKVTDQEVEQYVAKAAIKK